MYFVNTSEFFELSPTTFTRGHRYKLFKKCHSSIRSSFFCERVINAWNNLPANIMDFTQSLLYFISQHRAATTEIHTNDIVKKIKRENKKLKYKISRNSAATDKPRRRVYRSLKVTKHGTIPHVRHSFLLCNITLSLRHAVFTIFDFKNVVTLKWGHRSLKIIESGIIRQIMYGFLLVFFSNFVPNMHRF